MCVGGWVFVGVSGVGVCLYRGGCVCGCVCLCVSMCMLLKNVRQDKFASGLKTWEKRHGFKLAKYFTSRKFGSKSICLIEKNYF